MKKLTFITCLVLLPLALQAQEDRYDQLTNPKLTSINKEAPRSTFTSYATEEDAIVNDRTNGASRLSLNGKWKFNYVENFADRPTDFMNVRTEVNRWPDINVPGNWELQGFGTPIYVNQPYEFCSKGYEPYWDKPNPPYVPKEWNPTGTYRRDFVVGNDWDGKEIFLSADGVRGAAFYYMNGKFVGMSKENLPLEHRFLSGMSGLLAHQRYRARYLSLCHAQNPYCRLQGRDSAGSLLQGWYPATESEAYERK